MAKHTQEYIEKEFEKEGYKLLSDYTGAHDKLDIQCPQCHVYTSKWNSFQQGHRCPECAIEKHVKNSKLSEDFVKKELEKKNYILASEYKKNNIKMKLVCPNGHRCEITWANFRIGSRCFCQSKRNVYNEDEVKKELLNEGYQLLSKYKTSRTEIKVQCPKKHIYITKWRNFKKGNRCPKCVQKNINSKLRHSQDTIKKELAKEGHKLLSEYINNVTPMKIQCPQNHTYETNLGLFRRGSRCHECFIEERKESIEGDIKNIMKQDGYKLLSKYKKNQIKMKIECSKGHKYSATWASFRQGKRCPKCINKSEQKFRSVMEKYFNAEFPTKRPKWLMNDAGNRLFLDGYNQELGIAFEYQGRQHFEKVSYFKDTDKTFQKRQEHDKIKKEKCKEMGIILLCPTYELEEDEYTKFIREHVEIVCMGYLKKL